MHELSVTQSLLDLALEQAALHGAQKITRMDVVVGRLQGLVEDSMLFYFEILADETPAKGAEVRIEMLPAMARCRECSSQFELEEMNWVCTSCGARTLEIISGREL